MSLIISVLLLVLDWPVADAHEILDNLVEVEATAGGDLNGQWEIPLADLEDLWTEPAHSPEERVALAVKHQGDIRKAVFDDLAFALNGGAICPVNFGPQGAAVHKDQPYVVLPFTARCPASDLRSIQIVWTFLNASEHKHQALVSFKSPGGVQSAILSNDQPVLRLAMIGQDNLAHFLMYLHDGAFHIWTGLDHILFLLTLILPSVLYRRSGAWVAREHFHATAVEIFKTVSAFTVAHSLTLALVTFHLVSLPSHLVASVIAVSVLAAGLNNLFPIFQEGRWKLAFIFGLVHGVSFADVLVDLKLPLGTLINSLVGFNVGVEFGQLAIVAVTLPLAYLLRETAFYRRVVFAGGSLVACIIAALWLVERMFKLSFMPF